MELNMEFIKAQLQRRTGERQLPVVASGSGVGLRTLRRILDNGSCTTTTATKVQTYLMATEKLTRLTDGRQ